MKILYLTASPQFVELPAFAGDEPEEREYPKLDLWPELKAVSDILFEARSEGYVSLEVVPEVRREDLQRYLSRREVNILHFSGHGDKDVTLSKDGRQEAGILFNEEPGYGEFVSSKWLKDQLQDKGITVVVLNCCWSKGVADALKDDVDVIIGTTSPLTSADSRRFSSAFYDALQRGMSLGDARDKAQAVIGPELYVFHPEDPKDAEGNTLTDEDGRPRKAPIWDTVIAPQPEEDIEEEQLEVMTLADRIDKVRDGYWENFALDLLKVGLGLVIAWFGYHYLDTAKSIVEAWKCANESMEGTFWGDFVTYIAKAAENSAWLKYEPFAIVVAFAAAPAGRLFGAPLIYLVAPLAKLTLNALSLRPREYVQGEIEGKRLESISEWLEEFER